METPRKGKQLEYTSDPNKFDLRTHVWDASGHLVKKNTYRSYIINGRTYFERPVNSGNLWFENNQPAGRVELTFNDKGHIVKKEFNFEAAHKEYSAPLTGAEKVHYELEQERTRNVQLKAELEAIKRESALARAVPKEEAVQVEVSKAAAPEVPKLTKKKVEG